MEPREGQFDTQAVAGAGEAAPVEVPQEKKKLSEKDQREHLIRRYIKDRIIALDPDFEEEDLSEAFTGLSAREKADLLYEKLMARYKALEAIRKEERQYPEAKPEPIDPYLISEIKTLWSDEEVANLFVSRYAEARIDAKLYRLSELGGRWQKLNQIVEKKQQEHEVLIRKLNLQQVSRPDQLVAARGKAERLAKELIRLREERKHITELYGLPPIPENTDIAAMIQYERLCQYQEQGEKGFIWLDSRIDIHSATIAALQNARWPVLEGEAGSGKSEQAVAAAIAMTGEPPTLLRCDENTNEKSMLMDKDIDPQTGGSYDDYGPVMRAATGLDNSMQTEPSHSGRIVRFDESGKLGSRAYSIVKEVRQKKQGDYLEGKRVLSGFGSIWTTNPVGPRYPDRTEPDPAMRRELAKIPVDYPPMTNKDPELHDAMLSMLKDENRHIAIASVELAPAWTETKFDASPLKIGDYWAQTLTEERKLTVEEIEAINQADKRLVAGVPELVEDATSKEHGTLWRLAFAVKAVQNAFIYGNAQSIPDDALRFTKDDDGKISVVATGEEQLILATSTITLGEVRSWMKGFLERKIKDNPDFQTDSLTEWIQFKLETYLNQTDDQDRDKIRAIFNYYHLFDPLGSEGKKKIIAAKPLTSKEEGYLSARVPRPWRLVEPPKQDKPPLPPPPDTVTAPEGKTAPEILETYEVLLEDGTTRVKYRPEKLQFEKEGKTVQLFPKGTFKLRGEKVRFMGKVDESDPKEDFRGKLVVEVDIEGDGRGGLHRLVTENEIRENGEDFWPFEKLKKEAVEKRYREFVEIYSIEIDTPTGKNRPMVLPSGEIGFQLNQKEYRMPPMEVVMAYLQSEGKEKLDQLLALNLTKMHLVPICGIGDVDQANRGEYTSPVFRLTAALLKKRHSEGKLFLKDGVTLVPNFNANVPIFFDGEYKNLKYRDPADSNNQIDLPDFTTKGSTVPGYPGWRVFFTEENVAVKRTRNATEPSPLNRLSSNQTYDSYLPVFRGEPLSGQIPEDEAVFWLDALTEAPDKANVIHDWYEQGDGGTWLLGASFAGRPCVRWFRDSGRLNFGWNYARNAYGYLGVVPGGEPRTA